MAQDGHGSCLGKSWLWQSQRVPRAQLFRRHLSLKLCWTALRRIHDPSIMWRPAGVFICKVYCSVQINPSLQEELEVFKVACHLVMSVSRNQPEFSSFTMQLLKMCDPTPFPTLPCGNPTTEPVNHNTHPTQISLHLLLPTIQLLYLFLPTHTEDRFTPTFLIFPFSI